MNAFTSCRATDSIVRAHRSNAEGNRLAEEAYRLLNQAAEKLSQCMVAGVAADEHLSTALRTAQMPEECHTPSAGRSSAASFPVVVVLAIGLIGIFGGSYTVAKSAPSMSAADRAITLQKSRSFQQAVDAWQEAVAEKERTGAAIDKDLFELGYCQLRCDFLADARATCDRLLRAAPTSPDHHYLSGLIHERAGDKEQARSAYHLARMGGHWLAAAQLDALDAEKSR